MDDWRWNDLTIVDMSPAQPGHFETFSSLGQSLWPTGNAARDLWEFGDAWENHEISRWDINGGGQWSVWNPPTANKPKPKLKKKQPTTSPIARKGPQMGKNETMHEKAKRKVLRRSG